MERIKPTDHLRRAALIGREVLLSLADRVDTHYADAINPKEVRRIPITKVETPCATEDELNS